MLAQLTGLPVVPMSAQIHSKKVLGSWDGFQVPLPFARCDIRMGEPIWVDRKGDEVEREVAAADPGAHDGADHRLRNRFFDRPVFFRRALMAVT